MSTFQPSQHSYGRARLGGGFLSDDFMEGAYDDMEIDLGLGPPLAFLGVALVAAFAGVPMLLSRTGWSYGKRAVVGMGVAAATVGVVGGVNKATGRVR